MPILAINRCEGGMRKRFQSSALKDIERRRKYGREKEKWRKCFSTEARKNEEMSSLYIGSETLFKSLF